MSKQKRILMVDDEPFNLIALEGLLNHFGFSNLQQAYNGKQALDIISQNAQSPFDLILTDN